jgi:hypothetical protein
MYCSICSKPLPPYADYCPACGNRSQSQLHSPYAPPYHQSIPVRDEPSLLLNLVTCCFPIVGIILYFIWKDEKPRSATSVCIWALVGFFVVPIVYVLFYVIAFVMLAAGSL